MMATYTSRGKYTSRHKVPFSVGFATKYFWEHLHYMEYSEHLNKLVSIAKY